MPRPRVKDEDRKRVARACDTCKRRKEKCDGGQPCLLCQRRSREDECHYSDGKRAKSNRRSVASQSSSQRLRGRLGASSDAEIAVESLLTLSGNRSAARTSQTGKDSTDAKSTGSALAPVPKLSRLLRDGHGKFIFVGDSSTLAFLQNVRRLVKTGIGECALTTDPKRHSMVEAIPTEKTNINLEPYMTPRPIRREAQELLTSYLLATSGMIDLFDQADITQHLLAWTEDFNVGSDATSSIFYLVLAIGAQNRVISNEDQAAHYFKRGRELAISSFMDDPSVLTVQSYILIAYYMLTTCRRNGAFMLLGIAIRAAYALGLHRSDISMLFEVRERETRERVWKSLRVLDMYLSASLGRPPATSEVDGGNISWEGTSRGYEDIRPHELHSNAMLRICFIFERVLNEVYCRREVSVQLVDSISQQYRDWNLHLDKGFQSDGLNNNKIASSSEMQQKVGLTHLKSAYYWSIILLTRPFLVFEVSSKLREATENIERPRGSETLTLSEACIDAAMRCIEIATDFMGNEGYPRRPVAVINSMFVSTLVIGLAMLGDYDKSFPLASCMEQAKSILATLAKHDPSATRYYMITGYLQQAVSEYMKQRDAKQLKKRRQGIQSIFGNILNQSPVSNSGAQEGSASTSGKASDIDSAMPSSHAATEDPSWPTRQDDESMKRGMTITTSGVLASSTKANRSNDSNEASRSSDNEVAQDVIESISPGKDNFPPYTEDFPLFSLMTEFDSMSDPFFLDFAQGAFNTSF